MNEARLLTCCLLNKSSNPHRVPCLQTSAAGSQTCSMTGLALHRCCSRRPWLTCSMTAQGRWRTALPGVARPLPQSWTCMRWSGAKMPVAVKQSGCGRIRRKVACVSYSPGAAGHTQGLCPCQADELMKGSSVLSKDAPSAALDWDPEVAQRSCQQHRPQERKNWCQQVRTHLYGARHWVMGMPCGKALCVSMTTCMGCAVLSHTGLSLTV